MLGGQAAAHVGADLATSTSAARRSTPGIMRKSSTAGSKGAISPLIRAESSSICDCLAARSISLAAP